MCVNVGTGSQISAVLDALPADPGAFELRPYVGGRYMAAGSALCGGIRKNALLRAAVERMFGLPAVITPCFTLYRYRADGTLTLTDAPAAYVILSGEGSVAGRPVRPGDCIFLPAAADNVAVHGLPTLAACMR